MNATAGRPRLRATLLLAVALVAGALGGIALERWVLGGDSGAHHSPEKHVGHVGRLRLRFEQQLARELNLSAEQQTRVDTLLAAQEERSRALMRQFAPQLRTVAAETEAGLREILTAGQWERFEVLRRERLKHRRGHYKDSGETSSGR